MTTIIAFLLSLLSNVIYEPIKLLYRKFANKTGCGVRYSLSEIIKEPVVVMKDRGRKEYGFQENVYCPREVDMYLNEIYKTDYDRDHNIVVITGRRLSGKSRAVWQFLRYYGDKLFKNVFIPNVSSDLDHLKARISKLPLSTLIFFDDIDGFWYQHVASDFKSHFISILSEINNRGLACLITVSNDITNYNDIAYLFNTDYSLGQNRNKRIVIVKIDDIQKDDEIFNWCTSNLSNNTYSKVIGGYIKLLTEHTVAYFEEINKDNEVVVFLTAFVILKKYRNKKRVMLERIYPMYEAIRNTIAQNGDTEIPETLNIDKIKKTLFKQGMLRLLNKTEEIVVDDEQLYESFLDYCTNHHNSNTIIRTFLSGTRSSELNQMTCLRNVGKEKDPAVYSRMITRSLYPGHGDKVINWFIEDFFDYKKSDDNNWKYIPINIKEKWKQSSELPTILHVVGVIVGRDANPIEACRIFLEAGITPKNHLISELIRSSQTSRTAKDKKRIIDYALELKSKYNIEDDLSFLDMMEFSESLYDEKRIEKAIRIYNQSVDLTEDERENRDAIFNNFCYRLVLKADSRDKIETYFSYLSKYKELYLNNSALKQLISHIKEKSGSASSPLFLLLSNKLIDNTPLKVREEVRNIGINYIIQNCPDSTVCLEIYNNLCPKIEDEEIKVVTLMEKQKKRKWLNILTVTLAKKMTSLSYEDELYNQIQSILSERLKETYRYEDYGAAEKLLNVIFYNQPHKPISKVTANLKNLFFDEHLSVATRNLDNLKCILQNAIEAYRHANDKDIIKHCRELIDLAKSVDEIRENAHMTSDNQYKLSLFQIIEDIKYLDEKGEINTDDVRKLIGFDEEIYKINPVSLQQDRILWAQVIRLTDNKDILEKIGEVCLDLATKKEVFLLDIINHLLSAFCDRFSYDEKLEGILRRLVDESSDSIKLSVFEYNHFLAFDLMTKELNIDEIKDRLTEAWDNLLFDHSPLRIPERADLLCMVIGLDNISFQQALEIVKFVIDNKRCRYVKTSVISLDTILEIVKKFSYEEARLNEAPENVDGNKEVLLKYAEEIQDLIYKMDSVDYSNTNKDFIFKKIKNPIDAPLREKYKRKEFTRIPLESDDIEMRRNSFFNRVDDNGVAHCSQFEFEGFISQELYYLNRLLFPYINNKVSEPCNVSDSIDIILQAIESANITGKQLKNIVKINEDRFIKDFKKYPSWIGYHNFFEGYLKEGLVPEYSREEWIKAAFSCGFQV